MKFRNLAIFVLVLALTMLSCGLPTGLLGGDGEGIVGTLTDVVGELSDSGGDSVESDEAAPDAAETPGEAAELSELDSYRLNIVWRGENQDGSEGFELRILQEWVKEPPAQRLVMSGNEPGQEPETVMEFILIGDQAWMGAGGTWMETSADQADAMAQPWDITAGAGEDWELVGEEMVNGVRCKHLSSGESQTVTVTDPQEGQAIVSMAGEVWVANEPDLPPVTVREEVEIEGGFFPFALPGATGASPEEGLFFVTYNLTDINAPITIIPPQDVEGIPGVPPTGEPGAPAPVGETPGASSPLPPPPAETQTKVRASDNMIMVYVPVGQFMMGDDGSPFPAERPAHLVYLDGYWIDKFEVTNAQYRSCVEAGACALPQTWDNADLAGDDQPALVMWTAADAYCQWAGGRLPTEAEWEKAARGTDGRLWPWGTTFEPNRANLSGPEDGYKATAPVGSYPDGASPYGLLDMAGNAAEWVADWWLLDYYEQSPAQNPQGPAGADEKVIRSTIANGGGGPEKCRTVARYAAKYDLPNWVYGFRCAKTTQP